MDATEFRRASHAVWEAMAAGWDERYAWFEETARPVTERMLERLAPARAQTILDLAAGVGVAGFAAAGLVGPDGRVIVSDFLTGSAGALAVVIDRLEDDERARVRHEIAGLEAPFAVGDGIELPALSLVASASSPGVAQVSRARPDPPRA